MLKDPQGQAGGQTQYLLAVWVNTFNRYALIALPPPLQHTTSLFKSGGQKLQAEKKPLVFAQNSQSNSRPGNPMHYTIISRKNTLGIRRQKPSDTGSVQFHSIVKAVLKLSEPLHSGHRRLLSLHCRREKTGTKPRLLRFNNVKNEHSIMEIATRETCRAHGTEVDQWQESRARREDINMQANRPKYSKSKCPVRFDLTDLCLLLGDFACQAT